MRRSFQEHVKLLLERSSSLCGPQAEVACPGEPEVADVGDHRGVGAQRARNLACEETDRAGAGNQYPVASGYGARAGSPDPNQHRFGRFERHRPSRGRAFCACLAGVLSIVLIGPPDAAQSVSDLSGRKNRIALGALMVIVMAAAIRLIRAVMFPVLKEHNEAFALGYVVTRTVEAVLLLPAAVGPLLRLAVSPPQSTAALAEPTQFRTMRTLLLSYVWRCGI